MNRTYGRRSCICHSSYIHNALTPKLIHAHLKTLKHTYKRTHTQTVHTRRLNELRFFFSYVEKLPLQPNSSSFSSSRVSKPGKRGEKRDFVRVSRAREQVLIYCNNGNTEARTFNLILKILFTKKRKNRFRGYILTYILVLFNEKKSIKLPRSRRREGVCQVLRNTIFLKKQRKTLVCDLLRRALSKK